MATQHEIAQRVVEAILAQKLPPGKRLGEQELAEVFGVSRTLVREGLMQLQARGFVEVRPRRGWYVVEPSAAESRDAFSARRIIETGILGDMEQTLSTGRPLQSVIQTLRKHIEEERRAIDGDDPATRAFVLADFHVCLASCLGHRALCDVLRDLTARTMLAASLYQSKAEARVSCDEHAAIVQAMEEGNIPLAKQLMVRHIGHIEDELESETRSGTDRLRSVLEPIQLDSP